MLIDNKVFMNFLTFYTDIVIHKAWENFANWPDLEQRPSELQKLEYHDGLPSLKESAWVKATNGVYELNDEFYKTRGGIFDPMPHYEEMFAK